MKTIIFFSLLTILSTTTLLSKDTIIMKGNYEVKADVAEIGIPGIKHQKFDNRYGQVIILPKLNVLMIKYESETKEVIKQNFELEKSNDDKYAHDKKYRALIYIGVATPLGAF